MTLKVLFAPLALAAGVAVALQAASNSGLKSLTGLGPALMINTSIVLIATIALWLGLGARTTFFLRARVTLYVCFPCGRAVDALHRRGLWFRHHRNHGGYVPKSGRCVGNLDHGARAVRGGTRYRSLRAIGNAARSGELKTRVGRSARGGGGFCSAVVSSFCLGNAAEQIGLGAHISIMNGLPAEARGNFYSPPTLKLRRATYSRFASVGGVWAGKHGDDRVLLRMEWRARRDSNP